MNKLRKDAPHRELQQTLGTMSLQMHLTSFLKEELSLQVTAFWLVGVALVDVFSCYLAIELREEQLWNACYQGDIDQVKQFIAVEGVDLNWKGPEKSVSETA